MPFETVAGMFDRLVPVVRSVRRVAGALAAVGAVAAALIAWALFHDGVPDDSVFARLVVAALALAPTVVLLMLWLALGELLELPARVRRMPEAARSHATELERGLRELDSRSTERRSRLRAVWRLAKLPASASETLRVYAPLTALLSIPFLAASALAALIVPIEFLVALIAVAASA